MFGTLITASLVTAFIECEKKVELSSGIASPSWNWRGKDGVVIAPMPPIPGSVPGRTFWVKYLYGKQIASTDLDACAWERERIGFFGTVVEKSLVAVVGQGPLASMGTMFSTRLSNMTLPGVRKGDIVPIAGFLFRAREDSDDLHRYDWIPNDKLPAGLKPVSRDSGFVPLSRGFGERLEVYKRSKAPREAVPLTGALTLLKVETEFFAEKSHFVATIRWDEWRKTPPVRVREGDILVLPEAFDAGLVVRGIVPRDPKRKTIGWAELSGVPIPLADVEKVAKAEKRTVVYVLPADAKK